VKRLAAHRGVALITAMLVTALAATTAVALSSRQQLDVRRTANVMAADQAYLYGLGIETVATELLGAYSREYNYDDPAVIYQAYTFPVDGGLVEGALQDMNARFNINNLVKSGGDGEQPPQVNSVQRERFRRLLERVLNRLGDDPGRAEGLVNAVIDWLDEDQEVTFPGGAEDGDYLAQDPPYRSANRSMSSASELLLVQGFDRTLLYGKTVAGETVPGLLKYVTALPDVSAAINVNTADTELLLALSPYLDEARLEQVLAGRPFEDIGAFRNHQAFDDLKQQDRQKLQQDLQGLTVASRFFLVNANVRVGRSRLRFNSLLQRNGSRIAVVSRAQGTDGL